MTYERKCENWLSTYSNWITPRIAAPASYVFWSGMFCLSAAIRRKVFIGKSSLGSWECFPHCYILLVGPPGFRKNTSMGPAIELLQTLSDNSFITKAPAFITKESLLDSIFKSPDSSVYLTVEEFGDILLKSGPDMYEFLTSMFDAKKSVEQKTMGRGIELSSKPCVNLLAGTTPQWIADKMPASVIGGGLASRIIFVFEDKAPAERIFFKGVLDKSFAALEKDLLSDLQHIATKLEGEFIVADEVIDWLEGWNHKIRKRSDNPKLAGFDARKITHILKIAQLFRISYSDELRITLPDIQFAVTTVESTEKNLPRVFAGVGKNTYSLDVRDIHKFINDNPNISRSRILKEFETVGTVPQLDILIIGLQETKQIEAEHDAGLKEFKYRVVKRND